MEHSFSKIVKSSANFFCLENTNTLYFIPPVQFFREHYFIYVTQFFTISTVHGLSQFLQEFFDQKFVNKESNLAFTYLSIMV